MSGLWYILRDGDTVTLCRQRPPQFDLRATTRLPAGNPVRYAHQIRQDLWRRLQRIRGFSPVVRLSALPDGDWQVEVGGRVMGAVPQRALDEVDAMLEDPAKRARWIRHAAQKNSANTVTN